MRMFILALTFITSILTAQRAYATFAAGFQYGYGYFHYPNMKTHDNVPEGGQFQFHVGYLLTESLELEAFYGKQMYQAKASINNNETFINHEASMLGVAFAMRMQSGLFLRFAYASTTITHELARKLGDADNELAQTTFGMLNQKKVGEYRTGIGYDLIDFSKATIFLSVERGWYSELDATDTVGFVGLKMSIDPNARPLKRKRRRN